MNYGELQHHIIDQKFNKLEVNCIKFKTKPIEGAFLISDKDGNLYLEKTHIPEIETFKQLESKEEYNLQNNEYMDVNSKDLLYSTIIEQGWILKINAVINCNFSGKFGIRLYDKTFNSTLHCFESKDESKYNNSGQIVLLGSIRGNKHNHTISLQSYGENNVTIKDVKLQFDLIKCN